MYQSDQEMSQTEQHPKYFDSLWLQWDEKFKVYRYSGNISMYSLGKVTRKLIICSQRTVDKLNRYLQGLTCSCSSFSSQSKGKTVQWYRATSWLTPSSWQGKKAFSALVLFFLCSNSVQKLSTIRHTYSSKTVFWDL